VTPETIYGLQQVAFNNNKNLNLLNDINYLGVLNNFTSIPRSLWN